VRGPEDDGLRGMGAPIPVGVLLAERIAVENQPCVVFGARPNP
jgi:hypothetical protein